MNLPLVRIEPAKMARNPQLVVFDLDYTLWPFWVDTHVCAPFKRKRDGSVVDSRGDNIRLYDDVMEILTCLTHRGIKIAAASRTQDPPAAEDLLKVLDIDKIFDYKEIYPGSKLAHFEKFNADSGIPYSEMLFFDDEPRNIVDISRLGVTCVQVPKGMTKSILEQGFRQFSQKHR